MNTQSQTPLAAFRRFVERFPLARLLAFAIPLFVVLVASQILMQAVAHALPPSSRAAWSLVSKCLYVAGMLWLYSLEVHFFERRPVSELALPAAARRLTTGVIGGFALFSSVMALLALGGYVNHAQLSGFGSLPAQAAASLGAAVGEELLFRGAIFRLTENWLGTNAALLLSALLFGAAHGLNAGATPVGIIAIGLEAGVLLGVAYSASRSLWLPIGMHFGWNFTEGGLFGTTVSGGQSHGLISVTLDGPTLFTGGVFGPEASILAIVLCLAAAGVLGIYSLHRGHWRPWLPRAET